MDECGGVDLDLGKESSDEDEDVGSEEMLDDRKGGCGGRELCL